MLVVPWVLTKSLNFDGQKMIFLTDAPRIKQECSNLLSCTDQERFKGGSNRFFSFFRKEASYERIDMDVVDGPADEVIPEQHGHLEVGLLSRHVRRHRRSERPSPENHHLRSPPCAWYSRGRRCGCGGARRGSAPRGDGPCGRSRVTRRRRSEKDAMVMARGLARPWVCGAASSPPRATARVRVGGAVSILAYRRGGGAAHALPLPEGGRHRLRPAVYEVDLHRSEQWDLLPAGGGGEDGGGYCSLAPAAAAAAARACSTALGAAAPQHRRTIQGAATALRLLYNASCRGSRARRPDRLAQAKNKIAERANMEGKR